mgnify:CR=1 FL=1
MARLSLGAARRRKNALARFKMKPSRTGKQSLEERQEELKRLQAKVQKDKVW